MDRTQRTTLTGLLRNPLLAMLAAALVTSAASAQADLIKIEFNEDDHPEFDIWPGGIGGSFMSSTFGGITVDVSTNTSFAQPTNRGSTDGIPPGYSYQHLYEDLLHAFTSTGTITLDFSGLLPHEHYTFTLYAWDPGSSGTHEWTITGGTSVPPVITVDFGAPLIDNDTFALVFDVTTTANGTFQVDNTAGLGGSAINGFKLSGASAVGTNYCIATPNSTGQAAAISAEGSDSIAANSLTLHSSPVPDQPCVFFLGLNQVQQPFGNGFLCVAGSITVLPPFLAASNEAIYVLDLPSLSSPISPGETWNFQHWYRDPVAGGAYFDTSNGLQVLFTP